MPPVSQCSGDANAGTTGKTTEDNLAKFYIWKMFGPMQLELLDYSVK